MSDHANQTKRMDFSRFPRRTLPTHETLFFEDEPSRDLYVLLSGSLGVYRNEVQVATIEEPLTVVGEISALTGHARNATVRALGPTQLVAIEDPDRLFEEYPQLGARLARILAGRLAQMNERFVELKGVLARGGAMPASGSPTPEPAAEPEVEKTLDLKIDRRKHSNTLAAVAAAASAATAAVAANAGTPAPGHRTGEVSEDVLTALSDLLDWDPSVVAGT